MTTYYVHVLSKHEDGENAEKWHEAYSQDPLATATETNIKA